MGFGSFESLCENAPLPLCPLIGPYGGSGDRGIEPVCYARSIEFANTIIFQATNSFVHIVALIMTIIMVLHVRSKFTAVGRKEITTFFYLFTLLTVISLSLDSGVVPIGSAPYAYFVAVQCGMTSALCTCLLINGFIGYQVYEDGTALSVWLLRIVSCIMFIVTGGTALCTFQGWIGLSPYNTLPLFILLYIVNALFLFIYICAQIFLVVGTLEDRWPLGDIAFGVFFFGIGQVLLNAFSAKICEQVIHYFDGLFFATVCNLLAVMMVYKYWDSITREDLEFSVGMKTNVWEVKELLPDEDRRHTVYQDGPTSDYAGSTYHSNNRMSGYGYY
ncbi:chitin synthase III catalytic subunit [Kalaharituber pfeilii]|nr:chitin synthase III catalytic subunit [Kalaharituber pfeilii]